MTHINDINEIRRLIARYYDGSCSPDEELELEEYFCLTPDSELPDDLRADAAMFRALAMAGSSDDIELPTGLDERLDAVTADAPVRRKPVIIRYLSIAAAAAVVIAIGISLLNLSRSAEQPNDEQMIAVNGSTTVAVAPDTLAEAPVDSAAVFVEAVSGETDSYRVVDDPEEAARITSEALSLLRDKMAVANGRIRHADNKINKISTTLNNIIKNEKI